MKAEGGRTKSELEGIESALLISGQLMGLAMRLDADLLERFLESKPAGFRYEETCRAAIEFRRAIYNSVGGAR